MCSSGCSFLTTVLIEVTTKWSWDPREGCRERLSPSANPVQPFLAALHCPWGTEKWVGADVSVVKSPSFWVVQSCPLTSSHQEVPTRKC